jgi:hypothetical protein
VRRDLRIVVLSHVLLPTFSAKDKKIPQSFTRYSPMIPITVQISLSYIEIYNDEGYDLLDENHTTKQLSDLPRVVARETEDGVSFQNPQ